MVDNTNIKRLVTDSVLCHTGAGRSVETVRQGRSVALLRCLLLWLVALTVFSCRDGYEVVPSTTEKPGGVITSTSVVGMYLLNEGNMGSNKCTLDYLDLSGTTATYLRNIYAERNPTVVKELGDVGNDIKVYGSKLWMVINHSNKVEVATLDDCRRVGQINIPNSRYVTFDGKYAYVSSYVGPVGVFKDAPLGCVYKVDTLSLKIVSRVTVGYQPDEMAIVDGKMYVANSGGYRVPNYDRTVSVVDLNTFKEERKIDVGINLHRCRADKYGQVWVTSRGDYFDIPSNLYWLQKDSNGEMQLAGALDVPVSEMCSVGDSLYFYATEWSYTSGSNTVTYGIVNVKTHEVVSRQLSSAAEIGEIEHPYGIIVNPIDRDFYLMDAKNYVSSGELLHFHADGTFDWRVSTGDIPAHAAFVFKTTEHER